MISPQQKAAIVRLTVFPANIQILVSPKMVELALVLYLKWVLEIVFKSLIANRGPIMHLFPGTVLIVKFVNELVEFTVMLFAFTQFQLMNLYLVVNIEVLLKRRTKALTFLKS